ncbi:cytochrome-c peroxidase [Pseudoxanthomonas sp. UC19_8]|uniref:cytochrome-c peroxidase n=1 Tax=Pseudoxanthomonas sp. UC19_8 TaxID=3350175 RepID=UPI0036D3E79B
MERKTAKSLTKLLLASLLAILSFAGCTDKNIANKATFELGAAIFSDSNLSADLTVSCQNCHDPQLAFSSQSPRGVGVYGLESTRNAPSLLGLSDVQNFFWDGREASLDSAVLQPFTNQVEMGLANTQILVDAVAAQKRYGPLFKAAFGTEEVTKERIARSLSAYLQSLPSGGASYDDYVSDPVKHPLSENQLAGLKLFSGRAGCSECHSLAGSPATFSDGKFHHAGIGFERVAGNVRPLLEKLDDAHERLAVGQAVLEDQALAELGRFVSTRAPSDLGAFRTPSLRNVAITQPYMHDGSIATLREAVEREIYYRSLSAGKPISLTVEEQQQLVDFLSTLNTQHQ